MVEHGRVVDIIVKAGMNNCLKFPNQSSVDDNPYDGMSKSEILEDKLKDLEAEKKFMVHRLAKINGEIEEVRKKVGK